MIRALGLLQRLEGGGVLALPVEPTLQARRRFLLGRSGTLNAERIAVAVVNGTGDPLRSALLADDPNLHRRSALKDSMQMSPAHSSPKRAGATLSRIGSTRPSSSASATSWAVRGA